MKTNDYSIFENWTYNRQLDLTNLKKIESCMINNGYFADEPIKVTSVDNELCPGKHVVIDGHHRLFTAEKLGLSLYYFVIENVKSKQEIKERVLLNNTNRKEASWDDFLQYNQDNPHYIRLKELKEKTGFSTSLLLSMYQTTSLRPERGAAISKYLFAHGKFVLTDAAVDKILKVFSVYLVFLNAKKPNYQENPKKYIRSISSILSNPEVDMDRLMDKIEKHSRLILPNTLKGCTRNLYKIYNHACKVEDKIGLPINLL